MRALVWFLVVGAALISAVAVCGVTVDGVTDLADTAHGAAGLAVAVSSRSLAVGLCVAGASAWLALRIGRATA